MAAERDLGEPVALRWARKATATAIFLAPLPVVGVVFAGRLGAFLMGVCFFPPIWLCWMVFAFVVRSSRPNGFALRAPRALLWAVIGMLWVQLLVFLAFCLFMPGDQDCFQDCEGVPVGPSLSEYLLGIRTGSPGVGVLTMPNGVLTALFQGACLCFVAVPVLWAGWLVWDYVSRRSRPSSSGSA
ncbi:MAG: hypothetical protein ACRC20_07010 [Segniliparus sp.]|uniref:hypothetical protein n=1 Tax=Segniliparus sp. TaxID=2804064 RepID=UPI003F358610